LYNARFDNNWSWSAVTESVALKTLNATTDRAVVNNPTVCVGGARSWTRIDAFLVDTRAIRRTVRADNALWSTIGSRSDHIGHTATFCLSIHNGAKCVGSARMRTARVRR